MVNSITLYETYFNLPSDKKKKIQHFCTFIFLLILIIISPTVMGISRKCCSLRFRVFLKFFYEIK